MAELLVAKVKLPIGAAFGTEDDKEAYMLLYFFYIYSISILCVLDPSLAFGGGNRLLNQNPIEYPARVYTQPACRKELVVAFECTHTRNLYVLWQNSAPCKQNPVGLPEVNMPLPVTVGGRVEAGNLLHRETVSPERFINLIANLKSIK